MCGMLGIGQLGVGYDAGPKISTVHEKWELLSHKVQSAFADQVQFSWLREHLVGFIFLLEFLHNVPSCALLQDAVVSFMRWMIGTLGHGKHMVLCWGVSFVDALLRSLC